METILVVDDEDDVRAVVRVILEKSYRVLDTYDPSRALLFATKEPIQLLLTDVVMPLMKGTELAHRLQALSPRTKVLLMSAYTLGEITASGRPLITKPFTPEALAEKVRQVLAQPSAFARPSHWPPQSQSSA